tara:strand:+ start:99 stop:548 length:450 start_codon:yes stop_codon:yes gene_type:complete
MPDTENNGNAAAMIALANAGVPFTVSPNGSLLVHASAEQHTEQPAATKPKAKTTPAKQTAWKAKQAQWYNTKAARANMAAHKKADNLPRYVDGKLYSFETARKLKMVTAKGNPTKAFVNAGKTSKTTYTVELSADAKALCDTHGIAYTV